MQDNPNVLSAKILDDATVTLGGGKVYTNDIIAFKRGGFVVRTEYNQGTGDIEATYSLESWDEDIGWIEEPLAKFNKHPDGTAVAKADRKTVDTFKTTQSEKYRVDINPTGGTSGNITVVYSAQTEE